MHSNLRKYIREVIKKEFNDLNRYSIDDNYYLYKDGIRQFSSTSKQDLIRYLRHNKPELIDKFNLKPQKEKEYKGVITLWRGHGYNEGNNYYSPSKEFALEFTRSGRESELRIIKINIDKIYKHNPLPRGYGMDDPNFAQAIKIAKQYNYPAIWVDEGYDQPNSVFFINLNKNINESQITETTYKVYHGTNQQFDKFDFNKATQGIVWFTDSIDSIKNQEHGGQGNKYIMTRYITINNPAGWDEYEKYGLQQLEDMGYDGVILPQGNKTDYFVFSNKSIRKAEPKEIKEDKLMNEYYNNLGIVRLYHRISDKQMRDSTWIDLIRSVFNKGLIPYGNEIGEVIWFSDKYDDYSKDAQFVVALDFDTSTNGNNKYNLVYEGNNAYAHTQIPFEDLIIIKIPVVIIHGSIYSNKDIIKYINEGLDADGFNNIGGDVVIFEDLFNKYVQPYINIPDFVKQLNSNKIKLINVLTGSDKLTEEDIADVDNGEPEITNDSINDDAYFSPMAGYGDRLRSIS